MIWSLQLKNAEMSGELYIKTEHGPAWLSVKKVPSQENVWYFRGGTISLINDVWSGGIEINHHRYFIRPDGTLKKKSGGIANVNPYFFYRRDKKIFFRLWENVLIEMDDVFKDELEYKGVIYKLKGRKIGTLKPVRSSNSLSEEAVERRISKL